MDDSSAPVTKADLLQILDGFEKRMELRFENLRDELISHVNILDENMRRDVFGAFGDRYDSLRSVQKDHGKRLNKIETVVAA